MKHEAGNPVKPGFRSLVKLDFQLNEKRTEKNRKRTDYAHRVAPGATGEDAIKKLLRLARS
jgi:hypothetical protein